MVEVYPAQDSGNKTEHVERLPGPPSPLEEAPKWVNSLMLNSQEEGNTFSTRQIYLAGRSRSGYLLVEEEISSSSAHVENDFEQAVHEQNTHDLIRWRPWTSDPELNEPLLSEAARDDPRAPEDAEKKIRDLPDDPTGERCSCLPALPKFSTYGVFREHHISPEQRLPGTEVDNVRAPLPGTTPPKIETAINIDKKIKVTGSPTEEVASEIAQGHSPSESAGTSQLYSKNIVHGVLDVTPVSKSPSDSVGTAQEYSKCIVHGVLDVTLVSKSPSESAAGTSQEYLKSIVHGVLDVTFVSKSPGESGRISQEYLKSIVHGGLDVTFVSLGVVASGAGGDAKTTTVVAIGLANLVFGLITHSRTVMSLYYSNRLKYVEDVGQSFVHGCLSFISFLFFGALAPITYGFSFRNATNRDYKFASTCVVALVCIVLLGSAQAHVKSKSAVIVVSLLIVTEFVAVAAGYETGNYVVQLLKYFGFDNV